MRLLVMVSNKKDIIPLLSNKLNTLGSGEGYEDQGNCGIKAHTMMLYTGNEPFLCSTYAENIDLLSTCNGNTVRCRHFVHHNGGGGE